MPRTGWTSSIVPIDEDQNVYLVIDDLGRNGRVYRETDVETADLETVILDLLEGQYKDPARVIAFNTVEGWSQDVSTEIAQELRRRCDLQLREVPSGIQDFVDRHNGLDRQPMLRPAKAMSWDRPFDQPIPLPSGLTARTLRDAANYIARLPKSEHDDLKWRLAVQMLIDAAEDRGPMMFAKMGMLRAMEQ
jgi:hypothetical protein